MWKYIVSVVSFVLGAVGIAGLPDDIKTWSVWLDMIDHAVLWYGLAGAGIAATMGGALWDWSRSRIWNFDIPIRDAIIHVANTTDHSYNTPSLRDRHIFERLHRDMCAGKLLVVGRAGEFGALVRISKRRGVAD